MAPREGTPLLTEDGGNDDQHRGYQKHMSLDEEPTEARSAATRCCYNQKTMGILALVGALVTGAILWVSLEHHNHHDGNALLKPTGPYKLVERQVGDAFFDFYDFYGGEDSLGSAGYNTYVSEKRAQEIGIINTTMVEDDEEAAIFMMSAATKKGPRESIRLEGKTRFNRGLFVLDLEHMPEGAGVWPAFWLTDESNWPDGGEIDIVEGINNQTRAKTALHTSAQCSMFAHVPDWAKTGYWDRATGVYDSFTGQPNFQTDKEADDCWNMAAHQWGNQGCVLIDDEDGSIGKPFNARGGGVYALEWDPANGYIKSWSFSKDTIPTNLERAMATSKKGNTVQDEEEEQIDPTQWGAPYAYFAIGDTSGCSADHFSNMHIVFNLAFCGTVAGNRFFKDCPAETLKFNVSNDPVQSCNAWIQSEPEAMEEAYWKIRGVYVYERALEVVTPVVIDKDNSTHK